MRARACETCKRRRRHQKATTITKPDICYTHMQPGRQHGASNPLRFRRRRARNKAAMPAGPSIGACSFLVDATSMSLNNSRAPHPRFTCAITPFANPSVARRGATHHALSTRGGLQQVLQGLPGDLLRKRPHNHAAQTPTHRGEDTSCCAHAYSLRCPLNVLRQSPLYRPGSSWGPNRPESADVGRSKARKGQRRPKTLQMWQWAAKYQSNLGNVRLMLSEFWSPSLGRGPNSHHTQRHTPRFMLYGTQSCVKKLATSLRSLPVKI